MFFSKKKLPFLVDRAAMEKAALAPRKTVDGSDSSDSFLNEEEIRNMRSRRASQNQWWIGFLIIHFIILAIYAGTILRIQGELATLRTHGLQLIQCKCHQRNLPMHEDRIN